MRDAIWTAGKYAVCCARMSGRSPDFDPDALIMNLVLGLLGHARPEAQLLGTEESAAESAALAPHSPKSGGGHPDPEKPEMGLEQGDVPPEKGKEPRVPSPTMTRTISAPRDTADSWSGSAAQPQVGRRLPWDPENSEIAATDETAPTNQGEKP